MKLCSYHFIYLRVKLNSIIFLVLLNKIKKEKFIESQLQYHSNVLKDQWENIIHHETTKKNLRKITKRASRNMRIMSKSKLCFLLDKTTK